MPQCMAPYSAEGALELVQPCHANELECCCTNVPTHYNVRGGERTASVHALTYK